MQFSADFLVFGTGLTFNIVFCTLLARWYVWPALNGRRRIDALILILWPHTSRFLNLAGATVSQVDARVPRAWVQEVAWGDFAAAVLALCAIAVLRKNTRVGVPLAWISTIFGLLDFCNSFGQGMMLNAMDLPLGIMWQIAVGIVPVLFTAHVLAIRLLLKPA